jgi:RsiW-degrading membrane proteinase PrsW (M82 family)
LQLLIPRILDAAAAHMAHSGYWGYFIGLSEAALHALSNALLVASVLFGAFVGVLSYAFFVAAI